MSDQWETYVTPVDDEPAAILLDMGIAEEAPDPDRSVLLTMRLFLKSPTEEGFASDEEEPKLIEIEDAFIDAVELTTAATLVGRITMQGWREFAFYAKSPEGFQDTIAEAMEAYEGYNYETDEQDDAEWSYYFDLLFPGDEDLQQIFNDKLIDKLTESGDSLTTERPVDHFANFRTAEDRQEFVNAVSGSGYRLLAEKRDEDSSSELPFSVTVRREHAVDWDTIDELTLELFEHAQRAGGHYEGWGSPVIRK